MDLLQEFKRHWQQAQFIQHDGKVLLAVSGGVDSMVMCDLFLKAGLPFGIAHCNFQLRGTDADGDEQLVLDWAKQHEVPVYHTRLDTKKACEEWKKGIQETARILRYEWLDEIRQANGYAAIATAHHANDNVETLLINLMKGTGMAGIHGIQPKNGYIIRPLLFAEKADMNEYALANNVPYREDASNKKEDYLRNAVRHRMVPVMEELLPGAVGRINASIKRFGEAEVLYKKQIEQERKKLIEQRGNDFYVPILKLRHRQPLSTICYELFKPFGYGSEQTEQIINLLDAESGHYIDSATHRVLRDRNFLIVTTKQAESADMILVEGFPCRVETEHTHFYFKEQKGREILGDENIAYIDMKRIVLPLVLRKWKTGDYFYPLGMGMKKKKLSKYFKDQKIPLHHKDRTWVLECDKRIAWVSGMRLDERFKVTEQTQHVLRIEMKQP